jgi:hypothetical protein
MVNREKLTWGLVLLGIGALFLLQNLGVLNFYWGSVWRLWPLIIVIIGINLVLPKNIVGNLLSVLIILGAFFFLVFIGSSPDKSITRMLGNGDTTDVKGMVYERTDRNGKPWQVFAQDFRDSVETVNLKISGGAIAYKIGPPTDQHLFYAETEREITKNIMVYHASKGVATIMFSIDSLSQRISNLDRVKNFTNINLHPLPVWNLKLNLGAGSADFDLSGNKIQKMDVNCGAASFTALLGAPLEKSLISIDSGAGSVKVQIPSTAPCILHVKTGLSSRDFPGFKKVDNHTFQTPGFSADVPHYVINLKGGLSSFTVELVP